MTERTLPGLLRGLPALAPFAAAAALSLLGACRSTEAPEEPPPPPPPWTREFLEPAALIAEEIRVEGPANLLEHFASVQEPEITIYAARTTPQGLVQETTMRPGIGGAEIRGQLDAWELIALRRLVVLQRYDPAAPVTIRASGNAYFARGDGTEERREDTLVFRGGPPR